MYVSHHGHCCRLIALKYLALPPAFMYMYVHVATFKATASLVFVRALSYTAVQRHEIFRTSDFDVQIFHSVTQQLLLEMSHALCPLLISYILFSKS